MSEHDFAQMRKAMVESQLRTSDVNEPAILAAMSAVPREEFAPAALASVAYMDRSLPLGEGRMMSPPLALGRMLVEAQPVAGDRVLLIGAAMGYAAAVLARLVESVVAVESDAALAGHARAALNGADNVTLVEGPLDAGHVAGAPYSLILIDGAVEQVPDAIAAQLAADGRLVTGLADGAVTRLAIGLQAGGQVALTSFADSEIPVLPGFAKERGFIF